MRYSTVLVILLSCLFNSLFANALFHSESATTYQHLVEVNKQWLSVDISSLQLDECIAFETDVDRIQYHLTLVEQ